MTGLPLPARTGTLARALAGLAALVLAGCDTPSAPTVAAAPGAASEARAAQPPSAPALSPAARRSRACVRRVPSGAFIGREGQVRAPDGSTFQTPQCPPDDGGGTISITTINGYIEGVWLSPSTEVSQLQSTWTVPSTPASYANGTSWYGAYAQLSTGDSWFVPELAYYDGRWEIGVEYCNSYGCWDDFGYPAYPGDVIRATIKSSACTTSTCTWTATIENVTRGTRHLLSANDWRNMPYVDGAALHGYGITSCSQLPTTAVQFTSISLLDGAGQPLTPAWTHDDAEGVIPACGYAVSSTATTATLAQNVPPPLQYSTTTSPSPARQYNPFSITITGSGFDPATAQVQLVGPGQYASCPTYCTLLPSFSSRTSTQLVVYPVTLSIAGTYKIYVRNGPGGRWAANPGTITVNPMY